MKSLMILLVGVCLLFASVPATAGQAADEAAVRKAVEKLFAAFNSHDVKAMLTLMDENMVPWEGGEQGMAAQEKRMTETLDSQKNMKGKLAQEIGIVFVTPDVAIFKGHGETTGLVDGEGKSLPPRKTMGAWVMKKKGDKWFLAAYFSRPIEE